MQDCFYCTRLNEIFDMHYLDMLIEEMENLLIIRLRLFIHIGSVSAVFHNVGPSRTDRHHIGKMPYRRAHAHPFHHGETGLEVRPFPFSAMRLPYGYRISFSVLQEHPWNQELETEAFYNNASSARKEYHTPRCTRRPQ